MSDRQIEGASTADQPVEMSREQAIKHAESFLEIILIKRKFEQTIAGQMWQRLENAPVVKINQRHGLLTDVDASGNGYCRVPSGQSIVARYQAGMAKSFVDLPEAIQTAIHKLQEGAGNSTVAALLRPWRRFGL
jgi:hypothetical protein